LAFFLPSFVVLRAVYTRGFCVRFSVRDGASAQQLPLLFTYAIAREKTKKAVGRRGAITDGETDAKNASVDGPLLSNQSPAFSLSLSLSDVRTLIIRWIAAQTQVAVATALIYPKKEGYALQIRVANAAHCSLLDISKVQTKLCQ
jgi:hypothetical protein